MYLFQDTVSQLQNLNYKVCLDQDATTATWTAPTTSSFLVSGLGGEHKILAYYYKEFIAIPYSFTWSNRFAWHWLHDRLPVILQFTISSGYQPRCLWLLHKNLWKRFPRSTMYVKWNTMQVKTQLYIFIIIFSASGPTPSFQYVSDNDEVGDTNNIGFELNYEI